MEDSTARFNRLHPTLRAIASRHARRMRWVGASTDTAINATCLVIAGRPGWADTITTHMKRNFSWLVKRVLLDTVRKETAPIRGGRLKPVPLEDVHAGPSPALVEQLSVGRALDQLSREKPLVARVVRLCLMDGCTGAEAAQRLGLPERNIDRKLRFGKAWLSVRLRDEPPARHDASRP